MTIQEEVRAYLDKQITIEQLSPGAFEELQRYARTMWGG